MTVKLRNASPVPMELPGGMTFGSLEMLAKEEKNDVYPADELLTTDAISAIQPPGLRKRTWKQAADDASVQLVKGATKFGCSYRESVQYCKIMFEYSDVFIRHKNDLGRCDLAQHEIHIKDKAPVYIEQFKVAEAHSTAIEEQVKEWLKLDIVQPSMSRYNSPIFVGKKKDGNFRLVQDFRALNAKTNPDQYSMRDVNHCIDEIGNSGSKIFSTIDLTSGFWQMVLKPECCEYTAFTVYGMDQYEFKTSPMGLLGCPTSFQWFMEAAMKRNTKCVDIH